jgi:hypothetical protein
VCVHYLGGYKSPHLYISAPFLLTLSPPAVLPKKKYTSREAETSVVRECKLDEMRYRGAACLIWRRFSNLFETGQSLFWATFGLVSLADFELAGIKVSCCVFFSLTKKFSVDNLGQRTGQFFLIPPLLVQRCNGTLIKKKVKFSSYIRKFRRNQVAKSYMTNGLLICG